MMNRAASQMLTVDGILEVGEAEENMARYRIGEEEV